MCSVRRLRSLPCNRFALKLSLELFSNLTTLIRLITALLHTHQPDNNPVMHTHQPDNNLVTHTSAWQQPCYAHTSAWQQPCYTHISLTTALLHMCISLITALIRTHQLDNRPVTHTDLLTVQVSAAGTTNTVTTDTKCVQWSSATNPTWKLMWAETGVQQPNQWILVIISANALSFWSQYKSTIQNSSGLHGQLALQWCEQILIEHSALWVDSSRLTVQEAGAA